jgi:hypothetical protein
MMLYSLLFYPWKFLWPVDLSPMYELPARVEPLAWRFLLPLVAVPVITAVLIALRRRWPGGLAAWVYSALLVLPVSGAVHAGYQLAHDRYSHLSGLIWRRWWAGGGVGDGGGGGEGAMAVARGWCRRWRRWWWVGGGRRQSWLWHDSRPSGAGRWCRSLVRALRQQPRQALILAPGGGLVRLVESHFRLAISRRPQQPDAYHNPRAALAMQGRHDEAEAALETHLEFSPSTRTGAARVTACD